MRQPGELLASGRDADIVEYGPRMAKLETRVAVRVHLEELRDWEVDGTAIERSLLVPSCGVAHLPVTGASGRGR